MDFREDRLLKIFSTLNAQQSLLQLPIPLGVLVNFGGPPPGSVRGFVDWQPGVTGLDPRGRRMRQTLGLWNFGNDKISLGRDYGFGAPVGG